MRCPACRADDLVTLVSRDGIAREIALRCAFFKRRFGDDIEKKDRTDVAHDSAAQILLCRGCGLLIRDEDSAPDFAEDHYAPRVMEQMLDMYIAAYRRRAALYQPLLPAGVKVVEVGSYVGGFLHVAREWGWDAVGVDIGHDTARFTRTHGYETCENSLGHCGFDDASVDGVFIWTCFEQIDDPHALLTESRRILRDGGVLVIRTPNALFYATCESLLSNLRNLDDTHDIIRLLGYANLLGFPHRYGFTTRALDRIAAAHGFTLERHVSDRHIPTTRARLTHAAAREKARIDCALQRLDQTLAALEPGVVAGPWFEATYRAAATSSRS